MRCLSLLPLLSLPLAAADFAEGVRAILPPPLEPAAPAAPAEEPATEPAPEAEPTAPQPTAFDARRDLVFTPEPAPAADASPAAHPEAYAKFKELLASQTEKNLYDFCPAAETAFSATGDEFAVLAWMEQAAREGQPAAQQFCADRLLINVRRDALQSPEVQRAYRLARAAADAGYDPAKVNVYMCLRNGVGVAKDEKAAEKYMLEACRSGGIIPRFKWLQISGRLQKFEDRDKPAVKGEIERKNHHVIYFIAMMAPNHADKVEWLQKAARLGNADAIYMLSVIASGQDAKLSYELLKEAISRHNDEAMFTLGTVLAEGNPQSEVMRTVGLQHDDRAGRHLIKTASMLGNAAAHFWLGRVYHDGVYGLPQDDARAYRHFEAGAQQGDRACLCSQGVMLLRGIGTAKDERRALVCLNAAANRGHAQAVVALAYALFTGSGVPADAAKAAEILQEAATMGYPEAYVYLAYVTAKGGANLPADERMAKHWIDIAAVDMKGEAQRLYERLMSAPAWEPEP
ncbi:MAG: tetratricopeptide repeat protein [Akkermansia sp.]